MTKDEKLRYVLTEKDAKKLFSLEEENLAPGDSDIPEGEYEEFIIDVKNKTVWEYCNWRWPDNPKKQLKLALGVLTFD